MAIKITVGRMIGMLLVLGSIASLIFLICVYFSMSTPDILTTGLIILCGLPPLGGLLGGIACLTEKVGN